MLSERQPSALGCNEEERKGTVSGVRSDNGTYEINNKIAAELCLYHLAKLFGVCKTVTVAYEYGLVLRLNAGVAKLFEKRLNCGVSASVKKIGMQQTAYLFLF